MFRESKGPTPREQLDSVLDKERLQLLDVQLTYRSALRESGLLTALADRFGFDPDDENVRVFPEQRLHKPSEFNARSERTIGLGLERVTGFSGGQYDRPRGFMAIGSSTGNELVVFDGFSFDQARIVAAMLEEIKGLGLDNIDSTLTTIKDPTVRQLAQFSTKF